ncbi:MAG TPA: D-alanyl-D-alanine carboxypeptidase family protein [Dyella sp.]|uniref:D-alanyl-D-alanine carboxypeptidase family protein n=1 Tax=Dyella sp. TaxID=1869338 RepID=UPI002B7CC74E|nr:D-alanyl-D-alanine carboxypeptidase family protein [Dyella sp.]HUB90798.1 D-alanyl-D-alanine carboxypeptidase family protein [Dyella sp.]
MANIQSIQPTWLLNRLWSLLAALLLLGLAGYAGVARAGYAAIVIDPATGEVLSAVNADEQNYPASLTKMMTLYLTFQALQTGKLKVDQELPISGWAASRAPTKLGLRPGQTISVNDCILGMVTKSANDAASVVAESLGGNESHFAEMMTAQAALLGMSSTHFANASGLPDPNNVSTARDMAKLAMALYRDFPQYAHYFSTKEFVFHGQLIRGHNNLMDRYPGMDGLKTGFTDASGFNLASTAVRDGRRLFAVVLGGRTASARDNLMARLLDDGFDNQPTPETLVAQAGMSSRTHRVLAALSPIDTAEADETAPAHRRVSHGCTPHRGRSCPRVAKVHHHKSTTRLAHRHKTKKVLLASSGDKDN